jgi:hypothetical protein
MRVWVMVFSGICPSMRGLIENVMIKTPLYLEGPGEAPRAAPSSASIRVGGALFSPFVKARPCPIFRGNPAVVPAVVTPRIVGDYDPHPQRMQGFYNGQ